ncbi:hypothetical protein [Nonomuraea monospora]
MATDRKGGPHLRDSVQRGILTAHRLPLTADPAGSRSAEALTRRGAGRLVADGHGAAASRAGVVGWWLTALFVAAFAGMTAT